jgi:outer membrane protein TolC
LDFAASGSAGGSRGLGSASSDNARLNIPEGSYNLSLRLNLPWERTAERNAFRNSLIDLQQSVRAVQELEDSVKLDIRNALRTLQQARESYAIQTIAVMLARRRVESTNLFLQAGRAEVRDVLEAQESLINAQNSLTAALVSYRVAELEIQRDMGLLTVDQKGLWNEYVPETQSE